MRPKKNRWNITQSNVYQNGILHVEARHETIIQNGIIYCGCGSILPNKYGWKKHQTTMVHCDWLRLS